MNDKKIIELLFARSQTAISHLQKKFGKYCHTIAYNILGNELDAQECVNDTYMRVWDSIPPNQPNDLSVYVGRIARNVSLNRQKQNKSLKRNSSADLAIDELEEMISGEGGDFSENVFTKQAINSFLEKLSVKDRRIFIQRYWYAYSIKEIADSVGREENYVRVKLHRLRDDLRKHLEKEGINV